MKRQMKKALILLMVPAFAGPLVAQSDTTSTGIQEEYVFSGNRDNVVKDANKQQAWPQIKTDVVEIPSITYNLIPNKLNVNIEPKMIKPAKVTVEESLKKLYRGYARAGFGLYTTAIGELYYMDGRSRNGTFMVYAKHMSSAGGVAVADSIPDNFSRNEVHLWGKRFVKKHTLEGGFDWERDVLHYYGFNPDLVPIFSTDSLEQNFNNIDGYLRLKSYYRDSSKVNYDGEVKFYNFRDNYNGNENNIDVLAHARKMVGNELYSLDFNVNYNQFEYMRRDGTERLNEWTNTIVSASPTATTIHDKWKIVAGATLTLDAREKFHFYPRAEANYNFLDNLFIPYAGIGGGLDRTTYKSVTALNPFVTTNPKLTSVNTKFEAYGGIRGTVTSNASFNARLSFRNMEDFMYFVNDSIASPGSQFQIIYDDLKITNLTGEVSVSVTDEFKLFARGDYYIYGEGNEAQPWNQPNTRFSLSANYNLQDKFLVAAEVYTVGKRRAKSLVTVEGVEPEFNGSYIVDLKGYADINLSLEYRYTKRLSGFVKFNNMFAARYEDWNMYNVQRFNAWMGATYSF